MDAKVKLTYELVLSEEEFKVIGLSLCGRKLNREQQAAAKELNSRLMKLRVTQFADQLKLAERALELALEAQSSLNTEAESGALPGEDGSG